MSFDFSQQMERERNALRLGSTYMYRNEWQFQFSGDELLNAATDKASYHGERLKWWTQELETSEAALRERGVEFREYSQTGGSRIETVLDPDLSRRVAECRSKIEHHRDMLREFEMYSSLFERNREAMFPLSPHDVRHFGFFGSGE